MKDVHIHFEMISNHQVRDCCLDMLGDDCYRRVVEDNSFISYVTALYFLVTSYDGVAKFVHHGDNLNRVIEKCSTVKTDNFYVNGLVHMKLQ